jgi:hypothetical protein
MNMGSDKNKYVRQTGGSVVFLSERLLLIPCSVLVLITAMLAGVLVGKCSHWGAWFHLTPVFICVVSSCVTFCCAVLCCAVLCFFYALLCFVMLCSPMLCYVAL